MPSHPFSAFDNSQLPLLLYITRHAYTQEHMMRPLHRHDGIAELLLVVSGTGHYIVQNHTYVIRTGDIILYNAGELHEVMAEQEQHIETLCFGMSGLRLQGYAPEHLTQPGHWYVRTCADEQNGMLFGLCDTLHKHMRTLDSQSPDELCRYLLASIVLLALRQPEKPGELLDPREYALVTRIRGYIDAHYAESVTLADISKALCISPYYAAHLFKRVTGSSPIQYLIRRRIGEAQTLLIGSDYTATQIATMVGYDNTNYFNTVFSRMVGLSPIRYRRQFCESMEGKFIQ